jgi:cobalamin biosynthesis protein CobT
MEGAIANMVGPVARQLERAFAARNKSLWQQGMTKGKMASNNLYRLSAGDDHIFKKKIEHKTRDVAVSLVVDCSGSMHGKKIYTAMCAAWVMSEVLQRLGVSNEVIGFTTGDINTPESKAMMQEYYEATKLGRTWDRAEVIRMPIFKSFDERFGIEQKKRMVSYYRISGALQNNIDGESVQYAYERLCKHTNKGKPKGKMMIVFSDGQPAAGVGSRKLNTHLKHVVGRIESEGTNIVGVGIMSNSVQQFYRKNVVLGDIDDLPGTVLNQLRDVLLAS